MGVVQGSCKRRNCTQQAVQQPPAQHVDVTTGTARWVGPYLISTPGSACSGSSAVTHPPAMPLASFSVSTPSLAVLANLPESLLALPLRCLPTPERLSTCRAVSHQFEAAVSNSFACRAIVLREHSVGLPAAEAEERVRLRGGLHHYAGNSEDKRRFAALHLATCGGHGAVSRLEVLDLESLERSYGDHAGWTHLDWLPMFMSCYCLRVLAIPVGHASAWAVADLLLANARTLRHVRLEGELYGDADPMDPLHVTVVKALGTLQLDMLHLVGLNWGPRNTLSLGTVRSLVLKNMFAWMDDEEEETWLGQVSQLPGPVVLGEPMQLTSLAISMAIIGDGNPEEEGVWDAQFLASNFAQCKRLVDVAIDVSQSPNLPVGISARTRAQFLAEGIRRPCSLDDSVFQFPHGAVKDTLYAEQLHWQGPGRGTVLERCATCQEVSLAADGHLDTVDAHKRWYCFHCWHRDELECQYRPPHMRYVF